MAAAAVALAQTTYRSYCDPLTCQQVEVVRRHQTKAATKLLLQILLLLLLLLLGKHFKRRRGVETSTDGGAIRRR